MLFSTLKASLKSVLRKRRQSFLGLISLSLGLICSIVIGVWVSGELSYDRFHENAENIYFVRHDKGNLTPTALAAFAKENIPDVVNSARLHHRLWQLSSDEKSLMGRIDCVDPSFLELFSFEIINGIKRGPLDDPNSIILTESMATKLFGNKDPIGENLSIEGRKIVTVTAIIKDIPFNSHLQFNGLVNLSFMRVIYSWYPDDYSWEDGDLWTYLLLNDKYKINEVKRILQERTYQYDPDRLVVLRKLTDMHLLNSGQGGAKKTYIYIWIGAALLILLSACINYVNLATSQALNRAREVGIRKTIGASRKQLIFFYLCETLILTIISIFLALIIIELIMPTLSSIAGRELSLRIFKAQAFVLYLVGFVMITGVIAGLYPALVLSSFKPVICIRNSIVAGKSKNILRKILVTAQFSISIFLVICVLIVFNQINFVQNENLGYDKANIIHVFLQGQIYNHLGPIMDDLDKNPDIKSYTFTNTMLDKSETTTDEVSWEGKREDEKIYACVLSVGFQFPDVFGIEISQGRYFSREHRTDISEGFIINESAQAAMGLKDPVGKKLSCMGQQGKIIGVVKDFNYRSLHHEIQPLIMAIRPNWSDNLAIKVEPGQESDAVDYISSVINTHVPNFPLKIEYFDDELDRLYYTENQMNKLFSLAALLAVIMSCLGLFGLTANSIQRRIKEIGIRKILGAGVFQVMRIILNDFMMAIVLATLVAWPLAYLSMKKWLNNFAFYSPIRWDLFALATIISLLVGLLTVGYYTLKAALSNPVNAIKQE